MFDRSRVVIGLLCVACGSSPPPSGDASQSLDGAVQDGASVDAASGVCTPFGDPPRPLTSDPSGPVPTCTANGVVGMRLGPWSDPDGTPRYACLWLPTTTAPVPLVIYLMPSLSNADGIEHTNLLSFLETTSLRHDGSDAGFAILAPQGRGTLHYYPAPDDQGSGWDMWYRQFASTPVTVGGVTYAPNVDVVAIDHFLEAAIATGRVDSSRTFVSGWSNGASFAYGYGLFHAAVDAIAVYSGGTSAFGGGTDPCPQTPVARAAASAVELEIPRTDLPVLHVHNACDAGNSCPEILGFDAQLTALGLPITDVIVDAGHEVTACASSCSLALGLAHHIQWPDAETARMLAFFAAVP